MTSPVEQILLTSDQYPISTFLYPAKGALRGQLIMAGATGVPQSHYRRFAEFASAAGYNVMTLDYRGIGRSRPASLRGFRMDYTDWATKDLAAVVDAMSRPDQPLYYVGHSYGCHAIGLLPNHAKISAAYAYGTGAGWHGWMPPLEALRVRLMWSLIGPLLVRIKGYLAWSMLGMGADLPKDVFEQWKHWSSFPHYFFDAPEMAHIKPGFASVHQPIMAANATDDLWAMPSSRDAFVKGYVNARLERLDIEPGQHGLRGLGHMGYFRASSQPLWQATLDWFEQGRRATVSA